MASFFLGVSVNADAFLKGTNVNGVCDCHSGNNSVTLDHVSYREVISSGITSMDVMALTYCEENGIPGGSYRSLFLTADAVFYFLFPKRYIFFLCSCGL